MVALFLAFTRKLLRRTFLILRAGDALPTDGAFKINVGADLVIWTEAFLQFITFTQTTDLNVAIVSSDVASISDNDVMGANSALDNITTSLVNPLPATAAGGSAITWSSRTKLLF